MNAGEQKKRMNENKEPKISYSVIQSFQCCFACAYSQLTEGGPALYGKCVWNKTSRVFKF